MIDALRLAVGTLTVLRVKAPRAVDQRVAGRAMAIAPLVGLFVGLAAAAVGVLTEVAGLAPLVCAVFVIGTLAVLTRALHLDGLADTADGLGSGRRGVEALAVMSRSDIGPFGVATLVLVVLLQVTALAQLWAADHGPAAVVVAAVAARAALPLACRRGVPGAKRTGLGTAVAGTVPPVLLGTSLVAAVIVTGGVGAVDDGGRGAVAAAAALIAGVAIAAALTTRCVARFGGVTGDVLGADVEAAATTALLLLAATTT